MLLMKEFLSMPGITLTSLGSIICSIVVAVIICTTEDTITTYWVFLEKLTDLPELGAIRMLHMQMDISFVKDIYINR